MHNTHVQYTMWPLAMTRIGRRPMPGL